jgi:molybdate transport system ATP-binding protein
VPTEDRKIGFVFQNYALFPHLSVFENVCYGLDSKIFSRPQKLRKTEKILTSLGIEHLAESMPQDLSGGEQQRVALARALVLNPQVLLLDEPLSALDVTTRGHVRRSLKKTLSSLHIPKILVTHDYEDAISLGDRILVMDRGHVIQEGTAKELLMNPRSPFVADFSGTNFFPGTVLAVGNGKTSVQAGEKGMMLQSSQSAEGHLSVMIYPWDIRLAKMRPANGTINTVEGTVMNILPYGNRVRVEMEGALPLTAEISAEALEYLGLREQDKVYAMIDPGSVQLLTNSRNVI